MDVTVSGVCCAPCVPCSPTTATHRGSWLPPRWTPPAPLACTAKTWTTSGGSVMRPRRCTQYALDKQHTHISHSHPVWCVCVCHYNVCCHCTQANAPQKQKWRFPFFTFAGSRTQPTPGCHSLPEDDSYSLRCDGLSEASPHTEDVHVDGHGGFVLVTSAPPS